MIQLPALCGTRESAAQLVAGTANEDSPIFSLIGVQATAQGFVDELCKQLIERRINVVTFLNPSEKFIQYFMTAHRLRSAKFTVSWRD